MREGKATRKGPSAAVDPPVKSTGRRRGRPWSFDRAAALEKAMLIFWRHGYEATSLNDLTSAIGVAPPSLYAAFGDKKQLFLSAVERYLEVYGGGGAGIIQRAPTARDAVYELLHGAARGFTQPGRPRGCLLVNGAINLPEGADEIRDAMVALRSKVEKSLGGKLRAGIRSGELPRETDAAALAAFYLSVNHGMALMAQDGASRATLLAVADQAMRVWPGTRQAPRG